MNRLLKAAGVENFQGFLNTVFSGFCKLVYVAIIGSQNRFIKTTAAFKKSFQPLRFQHENTSGLQRYQTNQ
jgi:hypothetical protein